MVAVDDVWSCIHLTDIFLVSPMRKAAWDSQRRTMVVAVLINSTVGPLFHAYACQIITLHTFKYVKIYYNFICQLN